MGLHRLTFAAPTLLLLLASTVQCESSSESWGQQIREWRHRIESGLEEEVCPSSTSLKELSESEVPRIELVDCEIKDSVAFVRARKGEELRMDSLHLIRKDVRKDEEEAVCLRTDSVLGLAFAELFAHFDGSGAAQGDAVFKRIAGGEARASLVVSLTDGRPHGRIR